jgi:hypothetical protein
MTNITNIQEQDLFEEMIIKNRRKMKDAHDTRSCSCGHSVYLHTINEWTNKVHSCYAPHKPCNCTELAIIIEVDKT